MITRSQSFWPYDEAYGTSVAHLPGSPYVYGCAGYGRIRRFQKTSGVVDATFALAGDSWFVDRSLQITPNGKIFYGIARPGDANGSIGVIGLEAIAPLPEAAVSVDAGLDRAVGPSETVLLPMANWTKLTGPGPVTFAQSENGIIAEFAYGGRYVLQGATTDAANANRDIVTLQVANPIKTIFAAGAPGRFIIPGLQAHSTIRDGRRAVRRSGTNFDPKELSIHLSSKASAAKCIITTEACCFANFQFRGDTARIEQFRLRVRFNDGFVAYLNGSEVGRFHASSVNWNSGATDVAVGGSNGPGEVYIDLFGWRDSLVQGVNLLAIHALNFSVNDDAFLILPELSMAVSETAYSIWSLHYTMAGNDAAAQADPDQDGIPNYAEFATGSNPTIHSSIDASGKKPTVSVVDASDTKYLQITYPRLRTGTTDQVTYRILFSPNMAFGSWRLAGTIDYPTQTLSITPIAQTDFEWVTERLNVPVTNRAAIFTQVQAVYTGQIDPLHQLQQCVGHF